jgi:ketosteroid isomerase-like protein
VAGLLLILASGNAIAQTNQQVAAEVIALAKAQWAAEMANQPIATVMKDVADDYTEFSSAFPTRIDGKDVNSRLGEAFSADPAQTVAAEMANAKVQVYGDVAILSYNYIGLVQEEDGSVEPSLAKSTRVYARQGGAWKLVHANFAPVNADDD